MSERPIVLAIGGTDPSGLAGLAVDVRTISALGAHPATVVSAITAQNSQRVSAIEPVPALHLKAQLEALDPHAISVVKTGLLANAEQIGVVADFVREHQLPLVVDPVLASSSGTVFLDDSGLAALKTQLLPLATLTTPNLPEALQLAGVDHASTAELAECLAELTGHSVLVKGGHSASSLPAIDAFCGDTQRFQLQSERKQTTNTRGTGCLFASAAATALALGERVQDAVVIAKMAINQGLRQGYGPAGQTPGSPYVSTWPNDLQDLPALHNTGDSESVHTAFPHCGNTPLGLYPIVDRAHWLERLLPLGVSTIQLRIKDLTGEELESELATGVAIARRFGARLFINDHWQAAIRLGAYGVHLGQEDLDSAQVKAIHQAGLRLGISTHCHAEVARAVAHKPSYIACGPVFPTTTKIMPWQTLGLEGLRYWQSVLCEYPLVAIAGIKTHNISEVAATGVSGVAMITAITEADDPEAMTKTLIASLSPSLMSSNQAQPGD